MEGYFVDETYATGTAIQLSSGLCDVFFVS
jgi:hypothetical protein